MKELGCECGMEDCFPGCGCEILSFLGKKWSAYIIMHLMQSNSLRFNEFSSLMYKLGPKTLSKRLKEAEELKLVERIVKPTKPVSISYLLTDKGDKIGNVLKEMKILIHSWTNE